MRVRKLLTGALLLALLTFVVEPDLVYAQSDPYDITATMPATDGATACQLYLDGTPVGGQRECDVPQLYPALIAAPGQYLFAYAASNASGSSAMSPAVTVNIDVIPPPDDPTSPPGIVVTCSVDGELVECPQSIVITIT